MLESEQKRNLEERMEKARLRGKHALEKELLSEVIIQISIIR
jgi:hypothetical protein